VSPPLTLSIDAMGGDLGPDMVVAGIDRALRKLPDARFLCFGDRARIEPLLATYPAAAKACTVHHTDEWVAADAKPSAALRGGRASSMRLAINAVAEGQADGMVSAGNTGALMAMAKFVLKTLPGVDRPAIVTSFPTIRGASVMLDLGANVDCDARNLVQFAVMGEVFARHVLGVAKPSIGLLNVGVEGGKGNESVRKAAAILRESVLPIHFHGFVEGDDICAGTVDVIVTDGFTGNVALKTAEGTAKFFGHLLKENLMSSWRGRLGALVARAPINAFRKRVDPRRYNGALLVGLNRVVVKSHGGTDAYGFAKAVLVAADLVRDDFNQRIKEDLEHLIFPTNGVDQNGAEEGGSATAARAE